MGICSSCLGLNRRASADPSDTSQLLNDPYNQHQYGSINANTTQTGPRLDPEEIRRQRDALERICAQTSDKLIDVSQPALNEEGARLNSEYSRLFRERFPNQLSPTSTQNSRPASAKSGEQNGEEPVDEATWLASIIGEQNQEEGHWDKVEPVSGPLTLQFDEALGLERRLPQPGRA